MRIAAFLCVILLTACTGERPPPNSNTADTPTRIISLDFCADQYVLKLADHNNILALSSEAEMNHSYMRNAAESFPVVRASAEHVLALQPDLVVRSYGGGPNAERFFQQAGIPVLTIGWAGDLDAIKTVTQTVADGLGQQARGQALIAEIDARIAALPKRDTAPSILYMTPTGVTAGQATLVGNLIDQAGLTNFEQRPGWHALPLERLANEHPDAVATSFYDSAALSHDLWSAARHPIARRQIAANPTIQLPGAWTACGAWFALDAVEALAEGPAP